MTALLLAVPLVFAAPVPKELKKDTPALNGSWKVTGLTFNGAALGGLNNSVWTFDGDSLTVGNGNGGATPARTIKTDPTASPKHFEFDGRGNTLGIYEIKGDALTIAIGQQRGARPTEFAGPDLIVYTFAREKVRPKDK